MAETAAERDVDARTARILAAFRGVEAPLLEILHAVQKEFGLVPKAAQLRIAEALNLSRAEVHGVTSFYHDFHDEPTGRHTLRICRAEACQSMGGRAHAERAAAALGIGFDETTPDGAVTLEAVFCLGVCACAPAAMLDGKLFGRLDAAMLDRLVAEARQ
jgi:formate dehydrogenase subunit gamma